MVADFSGIFILSNEFVVIGRASTYNLGVILWPQVAKSGSKDQNLNGMRLVSMS